MQKEKMLFINWFKNRKSLAILFSSSFVHFALILNFVTIHIYPRVRDFWTISVNSLFPECSFEWTVLSIALNRYSIAINLKNNNWTTATRQTGFISRSFCSNNRCNNSMCAKKFFFFPATVTNISIPNEWRREKFG